MPNAPVSRRLFNIVHSDTKLYLVFEFLDMDLKRYMDSLNKQNEPLNVATVKASINVLPLHLLCPRDN
jgi:cyclin-dependent kinase